MKNTVFTILFTALMSSFLWGQTKVNFDDLSHATPVPTPYQTLNWSEGGGSPLAVVDHSYFTGNGNANGASSLPNSVTNRQQGYPITAERATPFFFESVNLTSTCYDGMDVSVTGFLGGVQMYTSTVTISWMAPTTFAPNRGWIVDKIVIDLVNQGINPVCGGAMINMDDFVFYDDPCEPLVASIGQFAGNPFDAFCLGEQGVYLANYPAGGPPNPVESYQWTFSDSPLTMDGAPSGGGQYANDGTPRRIGATWANRGIQTVDLSVEFEMGCIVDAPQLEVQVGELEPTINVQDKEFCFGDPDVNPGLAGTGVRAGHPGVTSDPEDEVRIVWVLTAKPDNSDYAIGDEFTTPDCGQPFANYGELAVSWSGVIRVNSNSPVNGMGEEITGTYEFMAYAENCTSGCISDLVGPFSITVNPLLYIENEAQDMTVECDGSGNTVDFQAWLDNHGGASVLNGATGPPVNVALGGTAYGSPNTDDAGYGASLAIDGDMGTRWGTWPPGDPGWIYVDLGGLIEIDKVILSWDAHASEYTIDVSDDAMSWTTVYSETAGDGGIDEISFSPTTTQYVRMYGTVRGTPWGYSLWEFEIYEAVDEVPVTWSYSCGGPDGGINASAGAPWIGFMNVFDMDNSTYLWGSPWGVPDLVTLIDDNTLTLKPNRINDPNPYWNTPGNLLGNKVMEASTYVEDDNLVGQSFIFNGTVISNDLDPAFGNYAFIRIFDGGYGLLEEITTPLTGGYFEVAYNNTQAGAVHAQYGFTVRGPNVNIDPAFDAEYEALGSIVIGSGCFTDGCGTAGSTEITFTATGICNSVSTTATFTIEDTAAPEILTQASPETVDCDGAGNTAEFDAWLANNGGATAEDGCGDVIWSYVCEPAGMTNVIATAPWFGWMNVFDLSNNGLWGSPWDLPDLVTELDALNNTVTLKPNRINDPNDYWNTPGNLFGNKIMEANTYVERADFEFVSEPFDFKGTVISYDLDPEYEVAAFTKVLDPGAGWATVSFNTQVLSSTGEFAVAYDPTSYTAVGNPVVQYGFYLKGRNANIDPVFDADYEALGSIVIGAVACEFTDECAATGSTVVTFIAADECGNGSGTTATFTIQDITPPEIITEASGLTVECDGNGNVEQLEAWLENIGGAVAEEDCGDITWAYVCEPEGTTNVIAAAPWLGYMNVYESDDVTFLWGSPWALPDVVSTPDPAANTLTLQPNRINDPNIYWNTPGNLLGNKVMDAFTYIEDDNLVGQAFTFRGNVISDDLDPAFIKHAFIRIFDGGYGLLEEITVPMTVGDFEVVYNNTQPGAVHAQYGFTLRGPNVNIDPAFDDDYLALGSVVVGAYECSMPDVCGGLGTTSVTFIVTDECGNASTTSADFTIEDTTPPIVYCPSDKEYFLDPGDCSLFLSWNEPDVLDVCCPEAPVTINQVLGPEPGSEFDLNGSPYTIGYEVFDYLGNGPTYCEFTITINGYPEPTTTMACNDEVQLALNQLCLVQMNADMFLEGGPYPCYNEFEVYIDAPGYEGDNVSNEYISLPVGGYWVTTVDAVSGNNCSTYVEVVDKIGPEIVECPIYSMNCYDDVVLNEFGYVHPDVSGYPTADDNCSELVWNYYDEYEELGCASDVHEMVYRHWTVTDMNNGMTDECVQEISINRAGLADLSWPVNFDDLPGHNPMLECNSGFALDANGNPHPSVTGYPEIAEACSTFEVFYNDINYTSNCGPKILREWMAVDDCTGEIEQRTQIIRITDTTAPSFMLGEDMVLNTKGYECNADFEVPAIMHLEDNCDAFPRWRVYIHNAGFTGDDNGNGYVDADETWFVRDLAEGVHELCYFAIDNCGNEYSECIEVEVVDNIPPIPVCEQYKQVTLTPDGTAFVSAEDFDSGSFDNCGPVWFKVLRGSEYNNNNELVYDGGCQSLNGDDNPFTSAMDVWFDDQVGFCCDDLGSEHPDGVMVTLRVFEVDPGPGPVSPYDMYNPNGRLYGKYNDCWSVVQVECKLPPQIVAPTSLQVSCEENLDPYQNTALLPDVISVCGYDLSYEDSDKIGDVCGGRIERTWTAVGCEKSVSFRQYLYLNAAEPFDPCTISFPADDTDITCPNDTGEPGYPTWDENPCNIVTAEIINIDTFTFVDDACYKIVVDWAVIDWCVYEPNTGAEDNVDEVRNRKLVCNELVEDGYYRYTQILMVTDVYAPEIQVEDECEALTEGCYAEDVVIEASATDTCNVDQKFWWKYIVTNMDTWETVQYSYNFSPVPDQGRKGLRSKDNLDQTANASLQILDPLGVGNYQVTWSVGDGCGNANTATQYFSVVDKKPPTPFMLDVSTAYMSNCMVEVCAKMFDKGACDGDCLASYDNCSEVLYFTYTDVLPIILHPEWFDADNGMYYFNPETGVQYNVNTGRAKYLAGEAHGWDPAENTSCRAYNYSDLEDGELPPPYEVVQIYVWDQFALNEDCDDGNYDWAEIELYINNDGDCGPEDGAMVVSGSITQAETGEEVDDVVVMLDNNSPEYPKYILSEVGGYAFLGLATGEYELSAEKNDDWGNGVSTLDLVLIQKHLLGIKALDNSYDLIASDANLSGSISAADLFEFRKLILGVEEDLSGGKSWRFVADSYSFANPMSPWNELEYAEVVDIDLEENVDDANLVGIKLGDINGSAQANARATNLETRSAQSRHLVVNETALEEGVVEIGIEAKSFREVSGMQFTLELEGMSYVGIESGALQVTNNNVGTPKENRVTFSWNTTEGVSVGEGEVLFTLKLNNEREGLLSQRMRMSSALTQAEIYEGEELAIYELGLEVRGSEEANFALYQNEPNPFSAQTSIGFTLPQAGNYELSILDVTGKVVKVEQGEGERGYNVVRMRSEDLPAGLLYYQLESGEYSATKKMILIK